MQDLHLNRLDLNLLVALDEVLIHSWDLARSTGQPFETDDHLLDALMGFLTHMAEPGMEPAREGLFGPVVPVPPGAPRLDQVLGLTGRDPNWSDRSDRMMRWLAGSTASKYPSSVSSSTALAICSAGTCDAIALCNAEAVGICGTTS